MKLLFAILFHFFVQAQVLSVNDSSIQEEILNYEYVVINFYSPNCKVCAEFSTEYQKASENLYFLDSGIKFLRIDATTEQSSVKKWAINGFHHVLLLKKGILIDEYDGKKECNQLVDWVKSKVISESNFSQ